jgi:hypothetical protein
MTEPVSSGDRPVFELVVEAIDLDFEVRVNDVPALRLPGGAVRTAFDVNPYVITGENTLSLIVRPKGGGELYGKVARAAVALRRRESPSAEEARTVATLVFEGPGGDVAHGFERSPGYATNTPPVVERRGLRASQTFALETPFPPWFWLSAAPLARTEAVRAEVLAEHRRVHAMLAARDVAGLSAACALQARDYQAAYYLASPAEAQRLLGIAQTLADPDVEVEDFPEAALDLELLGGGRLAQLVDEEGKSPLRLRVRGASAMVGRFNCVLARAGGGWAIAR